MRASWGVGEAPQFAQAQQKELSMGTHHAGMNVSMPLTPPATPLVVPVDGVAPFEHAVASGNGLEERVVLLYVGRV